MPRHVLNDEADPRVEEQTRLDPQDLPHVALDEEPHAEDRKLCKNRASFDETPLEYR